MATINGTENPDDLIGTEEDDEIFGFGGDDSISGNGGNDRLFGGDGSDQIFGGTGDDLIEGAEGHDFLAGQSGNDIILGGAGFDFLRGDSGNDQLFGGDFNDALSGGSGDDLIDGGAGLDIATYDTSSAGVTVDLSLQGEAQNTGQGWDTLVGIEYVHGTRFNDLLIGDDGDNWLWGGTGFAPGSINGDDAVYGGGGNDLIEVYAGNDVADGGSGNDTLGFYGGLFGSFDIASAGATVSLELQGTAQDTGQGIITLTGFENLSGTRFADVLTGDANDNVLAGFAGSDVLSGGEGHDTLLGEGLTTGVITQVFTFVDGLVPFPREIAGNDILDGGEGHDLLNGGRGNDAMTGGGGHDTFVLGASTGDDLVTDFEKGDLLDLTAVAGVDDMSDLTIVTDGGDVVISWGTDASVTLEDFQPKHLSAENFAFAVPDEGDAIRVIGDSAIRASWADMLP